MSEYANKPDYRHEIIFKECETVGGEKGRILGFNRIYESYVKVGVIAGTKQQLVDKLPNRPIAKCGDRGGWMFLLGAKEVNGGYLCTYEIYKRVVDMASTPLLRALRGENEVTVAREAQLV